MVTMRRVGAMHAIRRCAAGGALPLACLALLVLVLLLARPAPARADVTTLDAVQAPLIRIDVGTGNVNVLTWDRATVTVDADPSAVQVNRTHLSVPVTSVPILSGQIIGPRGLVTLPEESFVVSSLGPEARDVVTIAGRATGPVTVTIPNTTALLVVQSVHGAVAIHQFTGGTFVARVRQGRVRLDRDGGDGFVQVMRGPVLVNDSNFNRLRTRTALGATVFERCRVRQIQATSINGSIVYDHGSFDQGLARFASETGDVAIGVDSPAQIGGRASGGKIFTAFDRHVDYRAKSDVRTDAVVDGGGPEVTAASGSGSIFMYDGSLRDRENLGSDWDAPRVILRRLPQRGATAVERTPRGVNVERVRTPRRARRTSSIAPGPTVTRSNAVQRRRTFVRRDARRGGTAQR